MSAYEDDSERLSEICDGCGQMFIHCDCTEEDCQMSDTAELVRVETPSAIATLSVDQVMNRLATINELMAKAMKKDVDYGAIPGTGGKPTLLKPGAEKLCVLFQLDAQYETKKQFDGAHLTVETYCTIYNSNTGARLGGASAICSTKEKKYAYRKAERVCPECGKAAIIKGKAEYGGGWLCWKKKDGCGAKFDEGSEAIESQAAGQSDNPDIADCYNTVLRIAEKRAHVAAVRQVTGASAIFDEEAPHVEAQPEEGSVLKTPGKSAVREKIIHTEDSLRQRNDQDIARSAKDHPSQSQAPPPRPAESRAKVADSVCRAIQASVTEDEIKLALKIIPKGFGQTHDEHYQQIESAKEEKKLALRKAEIYRLREELDFDELRMDMLAVDAGVNDRDNLNAEEAMALIKALEKECQVAGIPF